MARKTEKRIKKGDLVKIKGKFSDGVHGVYDENTKPPKVPFLYNPKKEWIYIVLKNTSVLYWQKYVSACLVFNFANCQKLLISKDVLTKVI